MTHPGWGTAWSGTAVPEEGLDHPEARRASHKRQLARRRRRIVRRLLVSGALVLAVVVAGAVWVGTDALHARGELKAAAGEVQKLQDEVLAGDRGAAAATLTSMQKHAATAQSDTRGPQWSAARVVPWFGANVRAVQTVSAVVDDLAVKALPALMDATSLADPATFVPVDGRVNLAPLVAAAPQVMAADAEVLAWSPPPLSTQRS